MIDQAFITREMEGYLLSVSGDIPDADAAEAHLETWLFDNHREFSKSLTLREVRDFISKTVGRYF